jgi:hypothetical protein
VTDPSWSRPQDAGIGSVGSHPRGTHQQSAPRGSTGQPRGSTGRPGSTSRDRRVASWRRRVGSPRSVAASSEHRVASSRGRRVAHHRARPPLIHRVVHSRLDLVDRGSGRARGFVDKRVDPRLGPAISLVVPEGADRDTGPRSHQGPAVPPPVASGASLPVWPRPSHHGPTHVAHARRDAIGIPVSILPSGGRSLRARPSS